MTTSNGGPVSIRRCKNSVSNWYFRAKYIETQIKCKVKTENKLKPLSKGEGRESKGGACAVIRALASHQYGPGSNHGVDVICEWSLNEAFFRGHSVIM